MSLSLSPPVHCPIQRLIYDLQKCAGDAEISEEVVNRTKPRKTGGKRKQTEKVTETYTVCVWRVGGWGGLLNDYFSHCFLRGKDFPFLLSGQLTFDLLMVGFASLWFVLLIGVRMQMLGPTCFSRKGSKPAREETLRQR